ncbi:hypothetical protein BDQ17DRAFT_1332386 [Cyathus striatus]|nr:hypothetical protein BDQ17DRAFT_1332386 [Cyathus striatus]
MLNTYFSETVAEFSDDVTKFSILGWVKIELRNDAEDNTRSTEAPNNSGDQFFLQGESIVALVASCQTSKKGRGALDIADIHFEPMDTYQVYFSNSGDISGVTNST